MKKLHVFILKSYLAPLSMTFLICLFVLLMQFLWKYVDDMVGKGLEMSVLAELMLYAALQVVPLALPLAILLASLMTFGSLGENYELTAIKSSGISLPRIMLPLIIFTVMVSYGAFKFSNNVLPVANLKLYSLLWSVRRASPEFDIKEKIFYDGITDFSIKVENKSKTTDMLYDIMIYDHRNKLAKNSNVTLADSGKMQISDDKKSLRLTLYSGHKYNAKADDKRGRISKRDRQSFRTDYFGKQVALIPMQGLDFNRFDEGGFKSNDRMKNLEQLTHDEDSLSKSRNKFVNQLKPRVEGSYFINSKRRRAVQRQKNSANFKDTTLLKLPKFEDYAALDSDSAFNEFRTEDKVMVLENAIRRARDSKTVIEDQLTHIKNVETKIRRHKIEWHRKFTLSFACFIFFFIGAPLGAIIRKGGLGMPVVISVLFFIVYYIIDTFGLKVSKEGVWAPVFGIWLSSAVLFPLGVFLTYKAATDSAILNSDAYVIFFQKVYAKIKPYVEKFIPKKKNKTK